MEAWRRRLIRVHSGKPYNGRRIPEISKLLLKEREVASSTSSSKELLVLHDVRNFGDIQFSMRQAELV